MSEERDISGGAMGPFRFTHATFCHRCDSWIEPGELAFVEGGRSWTDAAGREATRTLIAHAHHRGVAESLEDDGLEATVA